MRSYGIHEILAIKSHQTYTGILWDPWDFNNQISPNPMEYYGIHEILATKSRQPQKNLMGSVRF